jgi:hypothetical protein
MALHRPLDIGLYRFGLRSFGFYRPSEPLSATRLRTVGRQKCEAAVNGGRSICKLGFASIGFMAYRRNSNQNKMAFSAA